MAGNADVSAAAPAAPTRARSVDLADPSGRDRRDDASRGLLDASS